MKVAVIGIDGGCFETIQEWLDDGLLPNIRRLKENGVYGDLESCLPPVTFPNWKCYSTGKNPGKLGVYWWEIVDLKNKLIRIPSSQDFKGLEIWDHLNKCGFTTGILNMPTTYPPKKVKGFMVSGGPESGDSRYTFPSSLERILRENYDYRVHPKKGDPRNTEVIEDMLNLINLRFRVAKELVEEWALDFLHVTIFYINVIQHFFWRSPLLLRAWKILDKNIGDLESSFDNVFLISDHGSNKIKQIFYINNWLKKEGYLQEKWSTADAVLRINKTRGMIKRFVQKFPTLSYHIKNVIPKILIPTMPDEQGAVHMEDKMKRIDWERTKALASGQGPIYLNVDEGCEEYEVLLDQLIAKLEDVRSPEGERAILKAYKAREIYGGKNSGYRPDIVLDQNFGVHIDDHLGGDEILCKTLKWKAENKKEGLFIAYGKDVKKRTKIENVRIVDIAPTILYLFGLPRPRDMDGQVVTEILKSG